MDWALSFSFLNWPSIINAYWYIMPALTFVTITVTAKSLKRRIGFATVPFQRGLNNTRQRAFAAYVGESKSWFSGPGWRWFGIPAGLGITCLGLLQLTRTIRRERRYAPSREPETWQLALFRQIPTRMLSRAWGHVTAKDIPGWLRRPLLGLYVWAFKCNMQEALVEDIRDYSSLLTLFTRELKDGARTVSPKHALVSPSDGKVLHFGQVQNGRVEQVKGVTYQLDKFLGPEKCVKKDEETESVQIATSEGKTLYHIVIYLAPGDYHHFHSPTEWTAHTRRHFHGELLTVAPWAARKMPGLFTLNERAVLSGSWEHGFFSFTAVGAYNVGSIRLEVDKLVMRVRKVKNIRELELRTNEKGRFRMGQFTEKKLGSEETGLLLRRGDKVGHFILGSSIVLLFEAPKDFKFLVEPGQRVQFGQPLGNFHW